MTLPWVILGEGSLKDGEGSLQKKFQKNNEERGSTLKHTNSRFCLLYAHLNYFVHLDFASRE